MLGRRGLPTIIAGILPATLFLMAAPGAAQLVNDRLALIPASVETGEGTIRLDGMGGFETAVVDENQELNILDFSGNPAGFSEDRDSWSIDLRYSHEEFVERDDLLSGNDIRLNNGFFKLGYHDPKNIGVGGKLSFSEVATRDGTGARKKYEVVGVSLTASKYLFHWLSAGVEILRDDESEDVTSRKVYNISHESTVTRGGLGIGLDFFPGFVIGVRGQVIDNKIDGESRSSTHTDRFDWNRPGTLASVHGTIDRGRVHGVVDYTKQDLEGEESVKISWSERFIFNPTNDEVTDELPTFSEDRSDTQFRTRWRLDVLPRELSLSASYLSGDQDFTVVANPNTLGSLLPGRVDSKNSALTVGGSWVLMDRRLLVATEFKTSSSEVIHQTKDFVTKSERDEFLIRAGGEYLLSEKLVGRLGLTQSTESITIDTVKSDDFATTNLAVGLGLLPAGAIWQLDIAYDVNVASDLDTGWSRFSTYLKYLF